MKKKTSYSTHGQRADIGNITIYRMIANQYTNKIGPFVFLDHIAPKTHNKLDNSGTGPHPHRGIATLTYVIDGEIEHFDSRGNHQKVHSGGIQWMKAGNGIIHDETLDVDSQIGNNRTHAFQFWINLPAKIKAEEPAYLAIQSNEVPKEKLPEASGWIKVIAGSYKDLNAKIPNYSEQFIYHIQLESHKNFTISIADHLEVAAFLPTSQATINALSFQSGEIIGFDTNAGEITIENKGDVAADIILFGGENYSEPIAAEGPFVMNTASEIAEAYNDYYVGKYGTINK